MGINDGSDVGRLEGIDENPGLGAALGRAEGASVGRGLGALDGSEEGRRVGWVDIEGPTVGD